MDLSGVEMITLPSGDSGVVQGGSSSGNLLNIDMNNLLSQVSKDLKPTSMLQSSTMEYVDKVIAIIQAKK